MTPPNVHQSPFLGKWDLLGTKKDELNNQWSIFNIIYSNHYNYLLNIMGSLFTWEGLPETANGEKYRSTFFEMMLASQGTVAIAQTDKYGMVISPCSTDGRFNLVGNPDVIRLYPNFDQNSYMLIDEYLDARNGDKFVYCRNDNLGTAMLPLIVQTANMLTNAYMSMYANVSQQKFPIIITGKKEQKLSMEIMSNKIDAWEKYIYLQEEGGLQPEGIKVANKNMPFVADKLYGCYMDILNNFFMRIGINTIPYAKKERLLTDEVNSNNQAVQTSGDIYMGARLEICENYNRLFDGNLTVKRNVELAESLQNISVEHINNEVGGEMVE